MFALADCNNFFVSCERVFKLLFSKFLFYNLPFMYYNRRVKSTSGSFAGIFVSD